MRASLYVCNLREWVLEESRAKFFTSLALSQAGAHYLSDWGSLSFSDIADRLHQLGGWLPCHYILSHGLLLELYYIAGNETMSAVIVHPRSWGKRCVS